MQSRTRTPPSQKPSVLEGGMHCGYGGQGGNQTTVPFDRQVKFKVIINYFPRCSNHIDLGEGLKAMAVSHVDQCLTLGKLMEKKPQTPPSVTKALPHPSLSWGFTILPHPHKVNWEIYFSFPCSPKPWEGVQPSSQWQPLVIAGGLHFPQLTLFQGSSYSEICQASSPQKGWECPQIASDSGRKWKTWRVFPCLKSLTLKMPFMKIPGFICLQFGRGCYTCKFHSLLLTLSSLSHNLNRISLPWYVVYF